MIARALVVALVALLVPGPVPAASARQGRQNHLAGSPSPYLRMHATDPVEWYPWSPEALAKAKREQKPIFLSIGYSTCHWCHVMQAESFTDHGIAELLNQNFVPIKVDREERPDLDRVYMAYMTSVSGGGWPANVFLTPDLHPFYGVSYAPPDDRGGQTGLRTLLTGLSGVWVSDRDVLLKASRESRELIDTRAKGLATGAAADVRALDAAYASMRRGYDAAWGGFGGAPKFPRPVALTFLLRYHARTGAKPALDAALGTLRGMANGGLRDHVGGGFHRYTTDAAWRVPHFEKMLYDQAQLAAAYVDAYQVTRDAAFRRVAVETLDYVLRDLRDPAGGFYSAEDADSAAADGRHLEGAYYVWTAEELRRVTGANYPVVAARFGIAEAGNVPAELDIQGELRGQNVLWVRASEAEVARAVGVSRSEVRRRLAAATSALRTARLTRPRPARDDKVLVAWNGLMISALARAAQVFDAPRYLEAARASARFIQTRMDDKGPAGLRRRWQGGQLDIGALAEDYAYLISGLIDLYEADFDVRWLTWAVDLQERQDRLFWDAAAGGYFSTTAGAVDVVARFKDDYDGAEPSANSVSAMNLLRLWQLTDRKEWRARADALFRAFAPQLARAGSSVPNLAAAFDFSLSKPKQIVIAGQPGAADTRRLLALVHSRFLPVKVLMLVDGGDRQRQLAAWLPTLAPMKRLSGAATLYLCENYVCRLPTADLAVAARLLDGAPAAVAASPRPAGAR